jgi:hypothetical protein
MTTARRLLAHLGVASMALAAACWPRLAQAESADLQWIKGGPTPPAIQGMPSQQQLSCPLLVSPNQSALQPLSLTPAQVAAKNKLGCLSNNDAHYGADGCPLKLCGTNRGVVPLPAHTTTPTQPQLPSPR